VGAARGAGELEAGALGDAAQEAVSGPLERSLAARAHFHIGEVLYDRGEFSRALDEFKNAEELADANNPDRELFTKWKNHTSRAVANDKSIQ